MGFRDDREAATQRVETLEREIAAVRAELESATLRAAEVEDLRKRVATLTSERDELRRDVEPRAALRERQIVLGAGVTVLLVVAGAALGSWTLWGESQRAHAGERVAVAAISECEAQVGSLRHERDAARDEATRATTERAEDQQRLLRLLNEAQLHATGGGVIVTATITERSGAVPPSVTDRCAATVRDVTPGVCAVAVVCGDTPVFPFTEPVPRIHCAGFDGPWEFGQPLAEVRAQRMPGGDVLLIELDTRTHEMHVRETGPYGFALTMRIDETFNYIVR